MARISNAVVSVLNVLTLILGLAAVGGSIYILTHGANASDCQKVLRNPLLIGSVFVVLVSTLGIVGSLCRVNLVLYIFLFLTFLLILVLLLFIIFALFVTNKRVGEQIRKGWEFRRIDFSHWLHRHVIHDPKHWNQVKSCLIGSRVCQNLVIDGGRNNDSLIFQHLSKTQSGCCKPPLYCGFTMKNATFWVVPKTGAEVEDRDCRKWSNRQNRLCYDCYSCKRGVLADIRHQWKRLTVFITLVLVLLTTIYILGCYSIFNSQSDSQKKHHRQTASDP